MDWFFLGKKRSKFGKFLDNNSISQQDLSRESGVSKSTISRLCQPEDFEPNMNTAKKVINTLRKLGHKVDYDDFWSM
ncbi:MULTISPECIES: helix-turn-helix domain-containing protein [Bacillus]|uniref:helix-turn-helix domain-containing protein n=1 Tax=Bacillus TaxID=1386 RepID=UPI00030E9469|nr:MULTISPECIES: helix-turn-helix transcriptional regulator [Bacillus]